MLALAEEHAYVRAEEFVGGTGEKITIEGGHIDEAVRAVVDGVYVGKGAGSVGKANDCFDGIECADCVGCIANCYQPGAVVDFAGEVGQVDGAIFVVNLSPADG